MRLMMLPGVAVVSSLVAFSTEERARPCGAGDVLEVLISSRGRAPAAPSARESIAEGLRYLPPAPEPDAID